MWLYVAVAAGVLSAITVPLVAGARVVALSLAHPAREDARDSLDPAVRALIERYP
jgi:hypothetical protein